MTEKVSEKDFDISVTSYLIDATDPLALIRLWLLTNGRLEYHVPFESIPNERRNLCSLGVKTAFSIVTNLTSCEETYETFISLQYQLVNYLMSLPTINKYLAPLMFPSSDPLVASSEEEFRPISIKNLYQSFYYSKQVDMSENEKEEAKQDSQGNMIGELKKDEGKMFIFANTFELLHTKLLDSDNNFELYPVLQVLEYTSQHLARKIFDTERASIDDHIKIVILRNQLSHILDFKTTSKIFGHVFGEQVNSKHSIFEDFFNPQAAISLTKIYSTILMIAR